jgi:hypothetical protein
MIRRFAVLHPSWVSSLTNVINHFLLYATRLEKVGKVAKSYKKNDGKAYRYQEKALPLHYRLTQKRTNV